MAKTERELVRYNTRTKPVTHPSTTDFALGSNRIWGMRSSYKPRLTGEYVPSVNLLLIIFNLKK